MTDPSGFDQFGLSEPVLRAIKDLGYTEPTPVQTESIPPLLDGDDVMVQSRTGTGKTAAFGIPIVERIDLDNRVPQALVLCPTRELALQVYKEIAALGKHRGAIGFPIYGGASMRAQIDALHAGVHFVAGTPGRVLDHLRSRRLDLRAVRWMVLDEADEMLSMGFYEEVSRILERVPKERQTLLFSATLPPGVEGLIYRHQHEPRRIALSSDNVLVAEIQHAYYVSPTMEKPQNLARILLHEEPTSAIIFVNTRADARAVTGHLKQAGFGAEMLSGELVQRDREKVMGAIKRGELRFMVATDVAARGIDISNLSHVINYSVPENRDVYVHRTGRTGRIGRTGTAITLVGLRDLPRWGDIEQMKGLTIEERKLPTEDEIAEKEVDVVIYAYRHLGRPVAAEAGDGEVAPPELDPRYQQAAERLLEQGLEAEELARLLQKALAPPPESQDPPAADEPPAPAPTTAAAAPEPPARRAAAPADDPGKSPTGDDPGKSPTGDDPGKSPTANGDRPRRRRRRPGRSRDDRGRGPARD